MNIPKYAQLGSSPPRAQIFSDLRKRWLKADRERTSLELAERMGQNKQHISNWCKSRPAPWWAIMWLCHELGLVLVFSPDKIMLVAGSVLGVDDDRKGAR